MDHKVSKDMISSGMIPSGEKTQSDLGRTQYGSAPSPSSLMEAYRSIYEHHQKDADGKVIEHGGKEELNEMRVRGGGVSSSLPKMKQKQKVIDKLTGYQQTQKGVGAASLIPKSAFKEGIGAASLIPDSAFSNPNPRRSTRPAPKKSPKPSPKPDTPSKPLPKPPVKEPSKPSPSPKPDTPSKPSPKPPVKEPSKPSPKKPFRYKIDNSNMINTGLDLFDLVKGRLLDEGCDEQEAINIMVNLSEDELNEILGGVKGDGYIGHPRLGIKNPISPPKKETKKTNGGTGLTNKLGNRATDIEKMIQGM